MYRHFFSWIEVVQEGNEPLPHYNLCGMHMPSGRLIKYQRMQRCDMNNKMWWRRRDIAIKNRYAEVSFSLTGEDEAECIKGMENLKYLVRMLDRSDNNWPAVCRNAGKARQVWIRLGKLLMREGADP